MNDPYWENMGELLLMGLIGYIWESPYLKRTEKNISMLQDLIMKCNRDSKTIKPGERNLSEMDTLMDKHKQRIAMVGYESWAYKQYQKAASAPNRTFQTILSTCFSKLVIFDSNEIANMTSENGFRFDDLGKRKIALFVEVSDTDRSMDILSNLFYSQLINSLCSYADEKCENGALPIPVQFILDDLDNAFDVGVYFLVSETNNMKPFPFEVVISFDFLIKITSRFQFFNRLNQFIIDDIFERSDIDILMKLMQ